MTVVDGPVSSHEISGDLEHAVAASSPNPEIVKHIEPDEHIYALGTPLEVTNQVGAAAVLLAGAEQLRTDSFDWRNAKGSMRHASAAANEAAATHGATSALFVKLYEDGHHKLRVATANTGKHRAHRHRKPGVIARFLGTTKQISRDGPDTVYLDGTPGALTTIHNSISDTSMRRSDRVSLVADTIVSDQDPEGLLHDKLSALASEPLVQKAAESLVEPISSEPNKVAIVAGAVRRGKSAQAAAAAAAAKAGGAGTAGAKPQPSLPTPLRAGAGSPNSGKSSRVSGVKAALAAAAAYRFAGAGRPRPIRGSREYLGDLRSNYHIYKEQHKDEPRFKRGFGMGRTALALFGMNAAMANVGTNSRQRWRERELQHPRYKTGNWTDDRIQTDVERRDRNRVGIGALLLLGVGASRALVVSPEGVSLDIDPYNRYEDLPAELNDDPREAGVQTNDDFDVVPIWDGDLLQVDIDPFNRYEHWPSWLNNDTPNPGIQTKDNFDLLIHDGDGWQINGEDIDWDWLLPFPWNIDLPDIDIDPPKVYRPDPDTIPKEIPIPNPDDHFVPSPDDTLPPEAPTLEDFTVPRGGTIVDIIHYEMGHRLVGQEFTGHDAWVVYLDAYEKYGINLINLPDHAGADTYLRGPNDVGISAPGRAEWASQEIEEFIRRRIYEVKGRASEYELAG